VSSDNGEAAHDHGVRSLDRVLALDTGEVQPEGIDLNFVPIDSARDIFDRMAGGLEFDCSELSSSEFISRLAAKRCPFVALPVFVSRVFRHGFIFINTKSGIKGPKDLEGRRVGVQLYTMTAAIFIRGMLKYDHGVDLSTIRWVQGALEKAGSHGHPTVMPLLKPITIEINKSEKSLSDLLENGEIDATIGGSVPPSYGKNPDIQRLFPDYKEVEKDYYRRTRIFPIMHLFAIRRDIYDKHPFVATSLYNALCQSQAVAQAKMRKLGTLRYMLPWLTADVDEIDEVFGDDP
jgi:4,5-dihydroxyphthalate decarboxylase